jgi:hypothetical protein
VLRLAPEVAERVSLLDPRGEEVDDPVGGDMHVYRACAEHIEKAMAQRLGEVL